MCDTTHQRRSGDQQEAYRRKELKDEKERDKFNRRKVSKNGLLPGREIEVSIRLPHGHYGSPYVYWKCPVCAETSSYEARDDNNFDRYEQVRWDLSNGACMCEDCHDRHMRYLEWFAGHMLERTAQQPGADGGD